MSKRYLVNDFMTTIPGTKTFWHNLQGWFGLQFIGGDYEKLAVAASKEIPEDATLVIRNATYFGPLETDAPTISLVQDIVEGEVREMQHRVVKSSHNHVVYNSEYTRSKCPKYASSEKNVIPLPVDFNHFEPGNRMGLQQKLGLPDGCVCWVGASKGAAAEVKGWPVFLQIVRLNPDISFVAVFKDSIPIQMPPNMRCYERLSHDRLIDVMGACCVGLCTSTVETQHLAGIEMGGCGLAMVAPRVGCYYERKNMPGILIDDPTTNVYTMAIRATLAEYRCPQTIHDYWREEFDEEVVKKQWQALIEEVEKPWERIIEEAECSGQS